MNYYVALKWLFSNYYILQKWHQSSIIQTEYGKYSMKYCQSHITLLWIWIMLQVSGILLDVISGDPSVCKTNRWHVDIFRFSFINLDNTMSIPLNGMIIFMNWFLFLFYFETEGWHVNAKAQETINQLTSFLSNKEEISRLDIDNGFLSNSTRFSPFIATNVLELVERKEVGNEHVLSLTRGLVIPESIPPWCIN